MAEIKVEPKRAGGRWWLYLLGGLIVIALLIWLLGSPDEQNAAGTNANQAPVRAETNYAAPYTNTEISGDTMAPQPGASGDAGMMTPNPATRSDGVIRDMAVLANAAAANVHTGRSVEFQNVPVQSVMGQRAFFVGQNENQRVLIVMNEADAAHISAIAPGSMVTVNGVVRNKNDDAIRGVGALPRNVETVVHARSLSLMPTR